MSKALVAFLIAVSATTWIYAKFMRSTGSLTQRSVMAAGISGVVIFFIVFIILGFVF